MNVNVFRPIGLFLSIVLCPSAWATQCKCRQHLAEAEANGTCSRTEDGKFCDLKFTTTTPAEYEEFVTRLKKLDIIDPRNALEFAQKTAPEEWSGNDIEKYLPALFAISQRTRFQEVTLPISLAIKSRSLDRDKLKSAFTGRGKSSTKMQVGQFTAVVSRGCIELLGTVEGRQVVSMVKTRFAESRLLCDDFQDRKGRRP